MNVGIVSIGFFLEAIGQAASRARSENLNLSVCWFFAHWFGLVRVHRDKIQISARVFVELVEEAFKVWSHGSPCAVGCFFLHPACLKLLCL